jgi:hypothetical protein
MVEPSQLEMTPQGEFVHGQAPPCEPSGVSFLGVLGFGIALGVLGIVVNVVLWFVFRLYTPTADETRPWSAEVAPAVEFRPPVSPRLEGLETVDILRLPDVQAEKLAQSYGWVDRKQGIIHIPISEAIKLTAGKLPARPQPATEDDRSKTRQTTSGSTGGGNALETMQ